MYKQSVASDEIAELMRRELLTEEVEKATHTSKLNHAIHCLNKAAEIFDDIKMYKEAEATTLFLENFANKE